MLFPLNQVEECELGLMEEIPDTFFNTIISNDDFGFHLFPGWFESKRGTRTDGIYAKGLALFNQIKATGRESEIVQWYSDYKNVDLHSRDTSTTINYLTSISQELHNSAQEFFSSLYEAFDSKWFKEHARIDVRTYILKFKRTNDVFVCPVCGSETITHGSKEARSALDHWFCKAKYPFLGVHLNNLIPMGGGCNNPPRKGQNELIYSDNTRAQRQEFYYPFNYDGEVKVTLTCIREPTNIEEDLGEWLFEFTGSDASHQALIDRWSSFFEISDRWVVDVLENYILSWSDEIANTIRSWSGDGVNIEDTENYRQAIVTLRSGKEVFKANPHNRIQWHFLGFILNDASNGLFEAYRAIVKENLLNE